MQQGCGGNGNIHGKVMNVARQSCASLAEMSIKMVRTFHSVGQGAYYTEQFLRGGRPVYTMAYDCGSTSLTSGELARVVRTSLPKGTEVDAVFISHFDSDHVNGLPDLFSAFQVKQLFQPFLTDSYEMAYWRLKSLADCGNDFSKAIAYGERFRRITGNGDTGT